MARLSAAALSVGHVAYTSAVMLMDECPSWRLTSRRPLNTYRTSWAAMGVLFIVKPPRTKLRRCKATRRPWRKTSTTVAVARTSVDGVCRLNRPRAACSETGPPAARKAMQGERRRPG